jgi:hypothetical protein
MGVAVACLASLLLAGGCATVTIKEARVVTGRVTDETGNGVAGTPVIVVGRTLALDTIRMEYTERGRQQVGVTTDAEGRYRLEFRPAELGNNFLLFFYAQSGFDRVQYKAPEALEITALLERERELLVNRVLQYEPAWPEIRRQMAFFGPESDRSRVLRRHGVAEKRETRSGPDGEQEVWHYAADGARYWFAGDRLVRTETFQPIPPAPPAPAK